MRATPLQIPVDDRSPIIEAPKLAREFGLKNLYILNEGLSPCGSQKDRIALIHVRDAIANGFLEITAATCGNYGLALAYYAHSLNLCCRIFIPATFSGKLVEELKQCGAILESVLGTYEDAVSISREYAESNRCYDANPGRANTEKQISAYSEIANDILRNLKMCPDIVACPVSNGTTLAGIWYGFSILKTRSLINFVPRLVAGSTFGYHNPIVHAFEKGQQKCPSLDKTSLNVTEINAPIVNWYSCDGDHALAAIYETGGFAAGISDFELALTNSLLFEYEGIRCQPAATAGLAALMKARVANSMPDVETCLAVVTAKRHWEH